TSFTPLNIKIDGEDIAHLYGSGWYTESEDANFDKVRLVITNAGHIVTGSGNARITMACSGQLTVTNLTLDASSWKMSGSKNAALHIDEGVNLELKVEGKNSFSGPTSYPGIFVGYGSSLTIEGDGELIASGGSGASGIGGSWWTYDTQLCGDITINGGRITAIGGQNCAGIGDAIRKSSSVSYWKRNGKITINGGVVTARGGKSAAGIGGGSQGYAYVTIDGGTVFATAGDGASAIGDGASPSRASTNTFGLAAIYLAKDEIKPAPKNGAGKAVYPISFDMEMPSCKVTSVIIEDETKTCKDIWTDETGKLTLWLEPTNGEQYTIKITAVDADDNAKTKVWGYKMDDEGGHEFSTDMLVIDNTPIVAGKSISDPEGEWDYDESAKILKILSGTHTITGSSTNGSINVVTTGSDIALTLDNLTLKTTYDRQSPFVISNNCTITLVGENTIECISNPNGATVSQKGSQYTAAVEVPRGASLTIEGEGTLIANAGIGGAGIGSRGATSVGGSLDAGSITIKGGKIYATGGWGKAGGGAGIGGGIGGGVASIVVNGGYVHAIGGKNACGIGGGYGSGVTLTNGTLRVTGGTVLAEKGEGSQYSNSNFSDFVTSLGNTVDVTTGKAIVIDGGSVRPKNAIIRDTNPYPNPVNSNGDQLSYAIINGVGLEDGEEVTVKDIDGIWPEYGNAKVYADEDGAICIWGVKTNAEHTIKVQSANIDGGEATFKIGTWTNTVQSASGGTAPDSREIDGKTCYRVEVHALPAAKRMSVTGLDDKYVHGTVLSDKTGKIYIYLPNDEYDFKVGGYTYHASVSDAVATATYKVGILVDGHDIGEETGNGWAYDGTAEKLTLLNQTDYSISGTTSERKVSVCVAHEGVGIYGDRLVLNAASQGPFYLDGKSATLEFKGGTIATAKVTARTIVSGGSLGMELPGAVARVVTDDGPVYTNAYRVTIGGLARYGHIEIEGIEECLAGYNTDNIWADTYGKVYLYLPDGDYFFKVTDGAIVKTMVAIVEGGETTAIEFEETGITINGREAARIRGAGWINEDGLVSLTDATTYVIAGTNFGAAVTFAVAKSGAALSLDNLVMTNAEMSAAAFAFGDGDSKKQSVAVMMYGTNIVHGAEGRCAMQVDGTSTVTIGGDGILEVAGGSGMPAIGGDMGRLSITGGVVVATCDSGIAAIGAGQGKVAVAGGIVSAAGGIYAEEYEESGGTVVADDICATTTVDGGSLHVTNEVPTVVANNTDGDRVYCVTVPTGLPNFDVGAKIPEWNGYSLKDVVSDGLGNVYIWLPNGTYYFTIGGVPTRAIVSDGPTTAEAWSVGVYVNGEDAALLSGEGWTYDVTSHALAITNDNCMVSGTNTTAEVYLDLASDVELAVSNLVLAATATEYAPINVASNAAVTVALMGTNDFTSVDNNLPAVHVPNTATLTLTNLNTIVSVPDLDNIVEYITTVTNIEEKIEIIGDEEIVTVETNIYDVVTAVTNYIDTLVAPVLTAKGAANAAAIGGGNAESYGTIDIVGGEIYAIGGNGGAGIGSGYFAESGDGAGNATLLRQGAINISGGKVLATGGEAGAGL
ncbi:MAG: hypothetical protein J6P80_02385, partial [Kiritimatiellae bacterium]|nr:hypothetical protein [Kiritimatiellia bacterium]